MREMMGRLRLTVNEKKTRTCRVPEETFDFLGYTFGRCYSPQTGRSYIGTRPSAKKVARLRDEIRELTDCRYLQADVEDRVGQLNRKLRGWSNYFCLGRREPGLRCPEPAQLPSAPPVVARKAPGERGDETLPRPVPARKCWAWSA